MVEVVMRGTVPTLRAAAAEAVSSEMLEKEHFLDVLKDGSLKVVPRLVAGSGPPLEPGGLGVGSCLASGLVPAAGTTPRNLGKPPSISGSREVIPRLLYIILIQVGEPGTDPTPVGPSRVILC